MKCIRTYLLQLLRENESISNMLNKWPSLPTNESILSEADIPLIHRDLSWLQFNDRVLSEARDKSNPLLERVKFLAISAANLDEFFMIRFASLRSSISKAKRSGAAEQQQNLERIRDSILESVADFTRKQASILDTLTRELVPHKIRITRNLAKSPYYDLAKKTFESEILPQLNTTAQAKLQQLTDLENLQMGLVLASGLYFPIPRGLPQVILSRDGKTGPWIVFFIDDLLLEFMPAVFGVDEDCTLIRLTRDGDLPIEMESEDMSSIPDKVRSSLSSREKGRTVRVQYRGELFEAMVKEITQLFKIEPQQAFQAPHTMCLHGLWMVVKSFSDKKDGKLVHPPLKSFIPPLLNKGPAVYDVLKKRDMLLHHPYDSFDAYVNWIHTASDDPQVEMIQQTVYRMDTLSPVIEHLKRAAKTKKVRVLIELRARFDELNNLRLAEDLRNAGVEVGFGFGKLKVHAKVAVVSRREEDKLVHYTHLSTGNYNAATASHYEDLAILTSNPDFGADAMAFFDSVSAGKVPTAFKKLVAAPINLHKKINSLIEEETKAAVEGRPARIVVKVNALVDPVLVEKLYVASQAGVEIDLIVRGACSLIPGIQGLSENIRIISVVDRYLEHSRFYYFAHSRALYLSSADWMPRNFFSRLELAFPILDDHLYRYIEEIIFGAYLCDTVRARKLLPQGVWTHRTAADINMRWRNRLATLWGSKAIRAQFFFEELARKQYKNTSLDY
jgi:polyphosphate kinase